MSGEKIATAEWRLAELSMLAPDGTRLVVGISAGGTPFYFVQIPGGNSKQIISLPGARKLAAEIGVQLIEAGMEP